MLRALLLTLIRVPFAPFWWLRRELTRPKGKWLRLHLGTNAVEIAAPPPFWLRFVGGVRRPPTNLSRVRDLVRALSADPSKDGLLVVVEPLTLGWAAAESLRESIAALRASGKKTVAYLPRGGGAKELFVALACERIVVSPPSSFLVPGFGTSSLYVGPVLEKLGVRFERFARREYKSAYENLERGSMSEGQRKQVEAMLAGFAASLGAAVETRAGVTRAQLEERGFFDPEWAKERGLVDAVLYDDELPAFLGLAGSTSETAKQAKSRERFVPAARYLAYHEEHFFPEFRAKPYVAVVPVKGVIGDSGPAIGIDGVVGAIRRAGKDPRARAIVLYVDSPGGSALGSDLIHREVVSAKRHKPVVAAFGNVAASGGYYVAAPADAIVARPLTITGSIGVVAARPAISEVLAKLGIARETVGDAPHGDLLDVTAPMSPASREAFDREIDGSYARFVRIVAEGRNRTEAEVEPLARGRVYLGSHAQELGLVDSLGGFPAAVDFATQLARAKDPRIERLEPVLFEPRRDHVPPPLDPPVKGLFRLFSRILGLRNAPLIAYFEPLALELSDEPWESLETGEPTGLSWPGGVTRSMRLLILALSIGALSACGPSVSHRNPGPMPEGGTFHGVWFSPDYGEMHLCQSNENVVGEYTKQERHGTVRGTVEGDTLHFQWSEEREFIPGRPVETHGRGYFIVERLNVWNANAGRDERTGEWSIRGEWGMEEDEIGGGRWTAVMQPRQSPDQCYNSIRRTVRDNRPPSDGEIHFADEQPAPAPTTP